MFIMLPVWLNFIAPEFAVLDSLVIHATCTALYHSSGFMLPAEGLNFSALVGKVILRAIEF